MRIEKLDFCGEVDTFHCLIDLVDLIVTVLLKIFLIEKTDFITILLSY